MSKLMTETERSDDAAEHSEPKAHHDRGACGGLCMQSTPVHSSPLQSSPVQFSLAELWGVGRMPIM